MVAPYFEFPSKTGITACTVQLPPSPGRYDIQVTSMTIPISRVFGRKNLGREASPGWAKGTISVSSGSPHFRL